MERHRAQTKSPGRLLEILRARRRPSAKPFSDLTSLALPFRPGALVGAFQTGFYILQLPRLFIHSHLL